MGKMLKMQMLEDEDDLAYETEKKERTSSTSDAQPAWMRTLHTTACNWLQLMPQTVNPLKRTVENIKVMAEMRVKGGWQAENVLLLVNNLSVTYKVVVFDSTENRR